jgi:hypothetical protein
LCEAKPNSQNSTSHADVKPNVEEQRMFMLASPAQKAGRKCVDGRQAIQLQQVIHGLPQRASLVKHDQPTAVHS